MLDMYIFKMAETAVYSTLKKGTTPYGHTLSEKDVKKYFKRTVLNQILSVCTHRITVISDNKKK